MLDDSESEKSGWTRNTLEDQINETLPMLAALLPCMGPCLRAFHGPCVGLTGPPSDAWFCPECDSGKMQCFICGEYSAGFDDTSVRKCSLGVCGRFYHTK